MKMDMSVDVLPTLNNAVAIVVFTEKITTRNHPLLHRRNAINLAVYNTLWRVINDPPPEYNVSKLMEVIR